MDKRLERLETYLKPMAVSEHIDIVKELKSQMQELQKEDVPTEKIMERLGEPKELAKAYLGKSISKDNRFHRRKLASLIAFYGLAGAGSIFVLPLTGICGIGFMVSGILCPIAGIIKFIAHFIGYEINEIEITIGSSSLDAVSVLPISILMGVILFLFGNFLWYLTMKIIRSMIQGDKKLNTYEV